MNEEQRKDLIAARARVYQTLKDNPLMFGMAYLEHHFKMKTPLFHVKLLKEALNNRFFAAAAPRESAKSTIISFLLPIHHIYFKRGNFIVIVQNTYAKAAGSLENIKKEVRENASLKKTFNLTMRRDSEGDSIFRYNSTGFECRVLCKGADQIGSVRGEKFGAERPSLLIIDDLEDDELLKNPQRRRDLQDLIDEALFPAVDKEKGEIKVIGTIGHDDSFMAKVVSKQYYTNFRKLKYKARYEFEGVKKSLWPEKWSVEYLDWLEQEKPNVFAKEYQQDPVSGMMSKFKAEDFRYWSIDNGCYLLYDQNNHIISKGELRDCKAAISTDLAWEDKREADNSVIMPGFLTPNSEILVDDYICRKGMRPDELAEILFSMEERYRLITKSSVPIGFEKAKLEKVSQWFLNREEKKRNHYLIKKDIPWDGDKTERNFMRISPRLSQHVVFFKHGMGDLEYELTRFPSGTHDDLVDGLGGLTILLKEPKQSSSAVTEDEFMWFKKYALNKNVQKKQHYVFGSKSYKTHSIPAAKSFR